MKLVLIDNKNNILKVQKKGVYTHEQFEHYR